MRILSRFILAAVVGIFVLVLGVFTSFVLSALALPDVPDAGRAPGDGFLVLMFIAIAVMLCVPLSIAAASWILFRPNEFLKQLFSNRGGLFLGR